MKGKVVNTNFRVNPNLIPGKPSRRQCYVHSFDTKERRMELVGKVGQPILHFTWKIPFTITVKASKRKSITINYNTFTMKIVN